MPVNPLNPMVVQSDRSVLLEVDNALYGEARDALARFAELEKSPEHIHTYRLSPLSLWNAAASGLTADSILTSLTQYSKYDVPGNIQADVRDYISRFGRIKLRKDRDRRPAPERRRSAVDAGGQPAAQGQAVHPGRDRRDHGAGQPGHARPRQEGAGGRGLSRGRPGGLCRWRRADVRAAAGAARHRRGVRATPLSAGCRGHLPRRRLGAGRLRRDRLAVRRGQNDGGHGRDEPAPDQHAHHDDQHGRGAPVDGRTARQDHADAG